MALATVLGLAGGLLGESQAAPSGQCDHSVVLPESTSLWVAADLEKARDSLWWPQLAAMALSDAQGSEVAPRLAGCGVRVDELRRISLAREPGAGWLATVDAARLAETANCLGDLLENRERVGREEGENEELDPRQRSLPECVTWRGSGGARLETTGRDALLWQGARFAPPSEETKGAPLARDRVGLGPAGTLQLWARARSSQERALLPQGWPRYVAELWLGVDLQDDIEIDLRTLAASPAEVMVLARLIREAIWELDADLQGLGARLHLARNTTLIVEGQGVALRMRIEGDSLRAALPALGRALAGL